MDTGQQDGEDEHLSEERRGGGGECGRGGERGCARGGGGECVRGGERGCAVCLSPEEGGRDHVMMTRPRSVEAS